ncbi:hypothetical protein COCON_G00221790 [Conger conger]|uniref:Uncharacterized protein n=1 Tax=Conger conger TaxID=82655 RepID=A0A9Q1CWJ4_CONCO|nr:hypothetical protein COCON_G00221790 [Conger conger]
MERVLELRAGFTAWL